MSLARKLRREADARRLAFSMGSTAKIAVNPTPPTKDEIQAWADANGVTVTILTGPTGKVEAVQTNNDFENDLMMRWVQSR